MNDRLERLLRVLPEPGMLVDVDRTIRLLNGPAAAIFGRPSEALVGTDLADLLTEDASTLDARLREAATSSSLIPLALTVVPPEGEPVPCRGAAGCLRPWSEGRPPLLYLRLSRRDAESDRFALLNEKIAELTHEVRHRLRLEREREELLEAEREARMAAEEAIQVQEEFLAIVSHELRTPLHTVLVWASLLRERLQGPELPEPPSDALEQGIEAIERASRTLADLIAELLDVSRLTGGQSRLRLRSVDLGRVVGQMLEGLEPTAELRGVELTATLRPDAGAVRGDPERLRQVAWHLVSNALKFTPEGGRVSVSVEPEEEDLVRLTVADTGAGIPAHVLPYVFDRFRQGEGVRRRSEQGLGLGLSIVRHVVELHGGTVQAESEGPGRGARFTIRLPTDENGAGGERAAAEGGGEDPVGSSPLPGAVPSGSGR